MDESTKGFFSGILSAGTDYLKGTVANKLEAQRQETISPTARVEPTPSSGFFGDYVGGYPWVMIGAAVLAVVVIGALIFRK